MKFKFILVVLLGVILSGCVGVSSKGIFGTGVTVAFDPVPTQLVKSMNIKKIKINLFFIF